MNSVTEWVTRQLDLSALCTTFAQQRFIGGPKIFILQRGCCLCVQSDSSDSPFLLLQVPAFNDVNLVNFSSPCRKSSSVTRVFFSTSIKQRNTWNCTHFYNQPFVYAHYSFTSCWVESEMGEGRVLLGSRRCHLDELKCKSPSALQIAVAFHNVGQSFL